RGDSGGRDDEVSAHGARLSVDQRPLEAVGDREEPEDGAQSETDEADGQPGSPLIVKDVGPRERSRRTRKPKECGDEWRLKQGKERSSSGGGSGREQRRCDESPEGRPRCWLQCHGGKNAHNEPAARAQREGARPLWLFDPPPAHRLGDALARRTPRRKRCG